MNYRVGNHSILVCVLLGLDILLHAIQIWLSVPIFFDTMDYSGTTITPLTVLNPETVERIALNLNFSYIKLSIHFIIGFIILAWIYRAHHFTSTVIKAKNLRFTDGACIVYFFIPFANLFMPYRAIKETWLASENPTQWQNEPTPAVLIVWWLLFLLQIPLCLLSFTVFAPDMDAALANGIALFAIVGSVIAIIQTLAFVLIVLQIQNIQNKYKPKISSQTKPKDVPKNPLVS